MAVSLNSVAEALAGYLVPGDGATFVATSTSGDWPESTRLRVVSAAGVETAFTPVIASTLATWTLTVAEVAALIGTRTSGQIQARITHGTGDALRGILAGPLTLISEWTGVRGTQSLGAVVVGPEGPTAVSADADNVASLGTDGLIYVAPGAGTVSSVNGETAQAINAQSGTTYTLVAADAGKMVTLTNAAAITLTVPGNVFTAGQRVDCLVAGSGMVTAVGSSCTVNGTPSLVSRAQWSAFTVLFTGATTAVLIGDLA